MPYFPDSKILFIHIPKNAGMYVERSLGMLPVFDKVPKLLHLGRQFCGLSYRAYRRLLDPARIDIDLKMRQYRYGDSAGMYKCQHVTLSEVLSLRMLDKRELDNCIVLAIHRNLLSRAFSMHQWSPIHKYLSFEEFCEKWILHPWESGLNYGQLSHVRTQASYIEGY